MKLHKRRFIVFCLLFLIHSITQPLPIEYMRGLYSELPEKFQSYSPIIGAVCTEVGLIKNYYTFGNEEDATIQLIRQLFNEVAGFFGPTTLPKNPGAHISPALMGKIVGMLYKNKDDEKFFENIQQLIINDKVFLAAIEQTKKKYQKYEIAVNCLNNQIKETVKNNKNYKSLIAQKDLQQKKKDNHNYKPETLALFVQTLKKACDESNFFGKNNPKYISLMPIMILQTFVWLKASTKEDLRTYFQNFSETAEVDLSNFLKNENIWKEENSLYSYQDENAKTVNNWKKNIKELPQENTANTFLKNLKLLEDNLYTLLLLQRGNFPPFTFHKEISYKIINDKYVNFIDCTEITILNLCNLISYDGKLSGKESSQCSGTLASFYKDNYRNNNPLQAGTLEVRNAWTKAIQHQPLIAYGNIVNKEDIDKCLSCPKGSQGFIYGCDLENLPNTIKKESTKHILSDGTTDEFTQISWNNYTYIVVDPDKYTLFEVQPSLKNVIILLNEFFSFKFYDEKSLKNEFFISNFNQIYFNLLCQKLNWEYTVQFKSLDLNNQIDLLDFNDRSFELIELNITTKLNGSSINFKLDLQNNAHAELKRLPSKEKAIPTNLFPELFLSCSDNDLQTMPNFLCAMASMDGYIITNQDFKPEGLMNDLYFYLYNLDDSENVVSLIQYKAIYLPEKLLSKLIIYLAKKQDSMYLKNALTYVIKIDEKVIPDLIKIVSQNFGTDENNNARIKAILFGLVERNQGIQETLEIGKSLIRSKEKMDLGISILNMLIKKNHEIEKVFKVIEQKLKHEKAIESLIKNEKICSQLYSLLNNLVKKDKGFEQALITSEQLLKNKDTATNGLKLLISLVEKDQGFKQALITSEQLLKDKDTATNGLKLLISLVEKDQGFELAFQTAKNLIKNKDIKDAVEYAELLLKQLIERNFITKDNRLKEVLNCVQELMKKKDTKHNVVMLFAALVEKNLALEKALTFAQQLMEDKDTHKYCYYLFTKLVEKGQGFEQAAKAAQQLKKDEETYDNGDELEDLIKEYSKKKF